MTAQGSRLDALTGEVETLRTDLPAQVVAGVLVGFERSAYATDLRMLQAVRSTGRGHNARPAGNGGGTPSRSGS